mmetsp:Transcript_44107/g.137338  ORF Transcript_44107/g.137338 Transcript_44107/m.137338 type:complete len:211 (+) Transcript_44107:96-728(+)
MAGALGGAGGRWGHDLGRRDAVGGANLHAPQVEHHVIVEVHLQDPCHRAHLQPGRLGLLDAGGQRLWLGGVADSLEGGVRVLSHRLLSAIHPHLPRGPYAACRDVGADVPGALPASDPIALALARVQVRCAFRVLHRSRGPPVHPGDALDLCGELLCLVHWWRGWQPPLDRTPRIGAEALEGGVLRLGDVPPRALLSQGAPRTRGHQAGA